MSDFFNSLGIYIVLFILAFVAGGVFLPMVVKQLRKIRDKNG